MKLNYLCFVTCIVLALSQSAIAQGQKQSSDGTVIQIAAIIYDAEECFPHKGSHEVWLNACKLYGQACTLADANRREEALSFDQRAIQMYPYDERFFNSLANDLMDCGRAKEAEAAATQATILVPGNWCNWYTLAGTLMEQGRWQEAQKYAVKANDMSPEGLRVFISQKRVDQIDAYLRNHPQASASTVATQSEKRNIEQHDVVSWKHESDIAFQAIEKHDYPSAETHYQSAVSAMQNAGAYEKAIMVQSLGSTKYHLEKYKEAAKLFESCMTDFEKFSETKPDGLSLNLEMLSRTYRHLGQLEDSLSYGQKALNFAERKYGKQSLAYGFASRNMGKLYLALKRPSQAESAFRQAIQNFDNNRAEKDSEDVGVCLGFLMDCLQMQNKKADIPPVKARLDLLQKKFGKAF